MKSTFRARLVAQNTGLDELNLMANQQEPGRRFSVAGGFSSKYSVAFACSNAGSAACLYGFADQQNVYGLVT